ncbi:MAG: GNAT family N-acetyltransferase [Candidatus Accumulibacter sp.]|uniref:arsenic resistance N-acetyltransferase ArsN2 n=1 Tax=Accumulibacter sp. TaxID=2053492 RepID=UPI0025DB5785|nr:arsenic resistance N-acetyltransferase ArsN2 [Accumulibacter sp.]MCP5248884.1 GNAT family N-acetyltransferase [Accumulibacter sp.]
MSAWSLQTPAADELPQVLALLDACALPVADLTPAHLPGFLSCRSGSRLIAVAGLERCGEVALLRSLAVAASHRQRGLASQLVDTLERRARADCLPQIFLLTTTARDFFARRGFQPLARPAVPQAIAETGEFLGLCPASAVCMVKTLASNASP